MTVPLFVLVGAVAISGGLRSSYNGPGLVFLLIVLVYAAYSLVTDQAVRRWNRSRRDPVFRFDTELHSALMGWRSLGTVERQSEARVVTDAGRRLVERMRSLVAPDVTWERVRDEYVQLIEQRCALIDQGAKGTSFDANDAAWQDLFERVQRLRRERFAEQPQRST
ncbi:MAG TPA: hypothetical protein VFI34_10110 [Candidatus Limnocylindrales bacterium]|nr:hypothetical protein [Candidatus Limnocylindrales bacterium]